VPVSRVHVLFKRRSRPVPRTRTRYHEGSTFIVECREDTWRAAGWRTPDDRTVAILEDIFAAELAATG
jgi:hypothetical protein